MPLPCNHVFNYPQQDNLRLQERWIIQPSARLHQAFTESKMKNLSPSTIMSMALYPKVIIIWIGATGLMLRKSTNTWTGEIARLSLAPLYLFLIAKVREFIISASGLDRHRSKLGTAEATRRAQRHRQLGHRGVFIAQINAPSWKPTVLRIKSSEGITPLSAWESPENTLFLSTIDVRRYLGVRPAVSQVSEWFALDCIPATMITRTTNFN